MYAATSTTTVTIRVVRFLLIQAVVISVAPARRRGADLVGAPAEDPLSEHGDRHHQQDDGQQHVHDLRGDAGLELQAGGAGAQDADEEGCRDRRQRVGPGEQGDGGAVEAQRASDGRLEPVQRALGLEGTGEPGEAATEDHRQRDDPGDVDARVARRVLVRTHGVEPEAQGAARQHPPAGDREHDGDDEPDRDLRDRADLRRLGNQLGLRDAAGLRRLGLHRAGDEPPRDARRDVVEHDRRDDLVHPPLRLQDTGDEADEGTGGDARDHAEHRSEDAEVPGRVGDPRAEHRAEDQLALATDVEQAHAQRDHHREAGEHQRGGLLQGAGQTAGHEEGLLDKRLVRVQRGHALQPDEHRTDEQGDDERHHDHHTALVREQERQRLAAGTLLVRRGSVWRRRGGGLLGHRGCLGHVTPMSVGAHSVACRGPGQKVRDDSVPTHRGRAPGVGARPQCSAGVGRACARPSGHSQQRVTPVCSVPASICLTTSSTLAFTSAGTTESKSWYGARLALPRVCSSVKSPALALVTVSVTPSLISFIAEVMRQGWAAGTVFHWSRSTPMQNLSLPAPEALAISCRAPLPVLPPAPKMMSAPWASCFLASPAPHTGSLKALSAAGWYTVATVTLGLAALAPASKPFAYFCTGGISRPSTWPSLLVLVIRPAR